MTSKIKNIIIFVVIAAVLIAGYLLIFKKKPEQPNLTSSTGNPVLPVANTSTPVVGTDQSSELSREFLSVLLNVKNIKLNDAIFSDIVFTNLRDSTIELVPDGTEGRSNPFAPLGKDNTVVLEEPIDLGIFTSDNLEEEIINTEIVPTVIFPTPTPTPTPTTGGATTN